MTRPLVLLGLMLLAACAGPAREPAPDTPPWRLVPANQVVDARHLVVTVALGDPTALAALSAALEADHPVTLVAEWPLASLEVHCFVFRMSDTAEPGHVRESLREDARVRTVQPMIEFRTLGVRYADDLLGLQAGLRALGALEAHSLATGVGVRVGVIDTQLDVSHPDLASRIGLARDFVGMPAEAPEVHGTAVAGVIAADAGNGSGMVGVAPDAELLALRGCWQAPSGRAGRCSSFSLARALNFALLNDVDVLNLSLGGPYDPLLAELIDAAVARGIIIVAARGAGAEASFPASAEGAIAVDRWSGRAEAGEASTFYAPGTDILSTAPSGRYDFFSGSSIAAAHVSGIAALMRERHPELGAADLTRAVARDPSAAHPGPVHACRVLRALDPEGAGAACPETPETRAAAQRNSQ